ncbi:CRISPR-associated endoribonuclease Cas6 [Clostridium baratii]|uniref:CRISPR-associated protein cas6 n=1 Tax=Clostridium baratii TaxID=1561 RepID=A0A174VH91_9CLOT|nr:CRISPR-associated endoribonuclease Cas6 [Clostridium baratii]CUQ30439.1 CRISPR-associated protein cas6 [Clostridium baratii]
MNFKNVTIKFATNTEFIVDYNYNYDVMISIYKTLEKFDKNFAEKLHNSKSFKLFNFNLNFKQCNFKKDYISGNKDSFLILNLSGEYEIVSKMVASLTLYGLNLYNLEFGCVNFRINKNHKIYDVNRLYKALTPIFCNNKNFKYLSPYEEEFYNVLVKGLLKKYEIFYGEKYNDEIFIDPLIETISKAGKKLNINSKEFYITAFNINFWIHCNLKMHELINNLGVGSKNSMGFGKVIEVKGGI